jgi:hypothetical protein
MKSHSSILSLSHWVTWVLLRKTLPMPIASSVFPVPSCPSFKIWGLTLRSLIPFELILVQGDKHRSSFGFLQAENFPSNIFSIICFWHLCQKLGGHSCMDSYPGLLFCSIVPCSFYCYGSVVLVKVRYCNTSSIGLFAQNSLGYSQSFVLPDEL